MVVKVKGLKNAQHLNGLTGIVKEILANSRRVVELDNGENKSLKPENLETIGTNGSLVTVTIDQCALPLQEIKTKSELDLSGKSLGVEDASIIAALMPLNVSTTSTAVGDGG